MSDHKEIPSSVEQGEKEKHYQFSAVNFGHPLRGFDRDQLFAFQFARAAGLVDPDAQINFFPRIEEDQLKDPHALNLEGFKPEDGQNKLRNNFTNDPKTDNPAAFMLYGAYSRDFSKLPPEMKARIDDLKNWIKIAEKGIDISSESINLKALSVEDVKAITPIFYALKQETAEKPDKARAIIQETNLLFDNLLHPQRKSSLRDIYSTQLESLRTRQEEERKRLENHLVTRTEQGDQLNSEHIRTTQTATGLQLTYVDVSGLGVEAGTFKTAGDLVRRFKGADTDILMLVDDEVDDDKNYLGKQIKIKVAKNKKEQFKDLDLRNLAEKLTISEELFGKGSTVIENEDFDGHAQIVGSPHWVGSEQNPEHVYLALQDYFNVPRHSAEQFKDVAKHIAGEIGDDHFTVTTEQSHDPYLLAQNGIYFSLKKTADGVSFVPVTLLEEELPLYENAFKEKSTEDKKGIVLAKTELTEHESITQERERRAEKNLSRYLDEGNAPMVLETLNQLNMSSLDNLPGERMLSILEMISHDNTAISEVWDKDNLHFRIVGKNLPDWIGDNLEQYKAARYDFQTLPSKIDKTFTSKIQEYVAENPDTQQIYAQTLLTILRSPSYIESHKQQSYDSHLQSIFSFLSDKRINENIRQQTAETLISNYGVEMGVHWRRAIQEYPQEFSAVLDNFSDQNLFEPLLDNLQLDKNNLHESKESIPSSIIKQEEELDNLQLDKDNLHESIEGIPNSVLIKPEEEAVKRHLAAQEMEHIPPTMTLLAEIGRDIKPLLQEKGILRTEYDNGKQLKENITNFDARIRIDELIRLRSSQIKAEDADDKKVAKAIIEQIKALHQIAPTADIRIIKGAFPGEVSDRLTKRLFLEKEITDELREKIILCNFNILTQEFCDTRLLDEG